ncbi:MAG: MerR family transcriptional regulator [Erysipelotrichaceae bacterium]|nr:MerR family transcriptional regulator [Erysipelotrichaceae bacterium]
MNEKVSLRQIKEKTGISRKAIQGYEKHSLIRASGKDRYGHLLYEEEVLKKIIKIRFFQKLGFTVSQIGTFIDGSEEELMEKLNEGKDELQKKIIKLHKLSQEIDGLIERNTLDQEAILKIAREED